jgi:serine/threonine protein kinase
MVIDSVPMLVRLLSESRLLDAGQVDQLTRSVQQEFLEPEALAKELVRRGWLTPFQIRQLTQGRTADLFLGDYVILEAVGEGAMGRVFRARHKRLGHIVALKVIRSERRADAKALHRFRREVKAAARFDHPNLITATDAATVGDKHYFAMEYAPGVNLDFLLLKMGPLPIAPACDYVRQAALGLQHVSECGLIHRDIKPGNLLVIPPDRSGEKTDAPGLREPAVRRFGRWGVVKILDLGLVLLQSQHGGPDSRANLTKKGFALGTVEYMAPEQVMNPHEVDIRADLYSLGCSLYEMLTGQPPFSNLSPVKTLLSHQEAMPLPVDQLRPDVPADLAAIVHKLLAKNREHRYRRPLELAEALAEILTNLDVRRLSWEWTPPPLPRHYAGGKPPRFAASRPSPLLLYGSCVVIALVALCLLFWFASSRGHP